MKVAARLPSFWQLEPASIFVSCPDRTPSGFSLSHNNAESRPYRYGPFIGALALALGGS
jgi:hypothetical protein